MSALNDASHANLLTPVVIESPCKPSDTGFSWDDHQDYLKLALRDSISRGEAPIASHGLFAFSNVFDDAAPDQRTACMEAGWCWIKHASAVIVYVDCGITEGMERAITVAGLNGVQVYYRSLGHGWKGTSADYTRREDAINFSRSNSPA
jgi:hypothetical protein